MKLHISQDKQNVVIVPASAREKKVLSDFPGLHKSRNQNYYFPARVNVCKNIINRLKDHLKGTVGVDEEVFALYTSEFKLREIPSSFTYFTTPLEHQEIALRFLYTNGGGGLLLDPGLGKTKVVLDYLALCNFKKSLIVCPKALLFVWEDEVAVHRPDKKIHIRKSMTWDLKIKRLEEKLYDDEKKLKRAQSLLRSLKKGKAEDDRLTAEADIVVLNYEKCSQGYFDLQYMGFDFMAIDEGLVKDPYSKRSKAITKISRSVGSVVIMSGTLVNNTPLDIYSPLKIMEPCLVGGDYKKFQNRYCVMAQSKDDNGNVKGNFAVAFKRLDEIRDTLSTVSIVMRKEEWLKDLPPKDIIPVGCDPSEEQIRILNELSSNYVAQYEDRFIEVESPLTLLSKMYQISNGFFYEQDFEEDIDQLFGRDSEPKKARTTVRLSSNPKIEKLEELYDEELKKQKFILWYNQNAEFDEIASFLDRRKIPYMSIRGGEKDTGGKVRRFNRNPEFQVLVCQAKSVNYGITVLGTKPEDLDKDVNVFSDIDTQVYTEVFYSLNFSLEVFLQQQDRIHRIGQTKACKYYVLINNTPVEIKIFQAIEAKMVLRNSVLVDIVNQIREGLLV